HPGTRADTDGPCPAVLESRQVDDGDVHVRRQLGERHSALREQLVEAHREGIRRGGRIVGVARHGLSSPHGHTVVFSSSSMSAPSLMMRAKVSSAAPASAGTGTKALIGWVTTSAKEEPGSLSM